ncbi:hypothetical protein EK904_014962, partial [Melospiza melodia maxima]
MGVLYPVVLLPSTEHILSPRKQKISEINDANNLLIHQLEKCNRLLALSQSKEESVKEECSALQNVIKGLTQTIENQCNVKDENDRLRGTILILEDKLKACEEEYKDQIEKLMTEIKNKEEDHKLEITQLNCDTRKKFELKEMEYREERERKELEILELTRQLKIQNEEKQNEIIKLQIEKLQHLQEEKNKEIEILRNTIRDLEQRLNK